MEEEKVYTPKDLYFDAVLANYYYDDNKYVMVFLNDKETESEDCLGDHNVTGLPSYLTNQMENEWAADFHPDKTVEEVYADMVASGFTHKKMIDWI